MLQTGSLQTVSGEQLTVVAHGTPTTIAGMPAKQAAQILRAAGPKPSTVELLACDTGHGRAAQQVANVMGKTVRAPLGKVNCLARGRQGIPLVRDNTTGLLLPEGSGWVEVEPMSPGRALVFDLFGF